MTNICHRFWYKNYRVVFGEYYSNKAAVYFHGEATMLDTMGQGNELEEREELNSEVVDILKDVLESIRKDHEKLDISKSNGYKEGVEDNTVSDTQTSTQQLAMEANIMTGQTQQNKDEKDIKAETVRVEAEEVVVKGELKTSINTKGLVSSVKNTVTDRKFQGGLVLGAGIALGVVYAMGRRNPNEKIGDVLPGMNN